jgi:hypothetical protein
MRCIWRTKNKTRCRNTTGLLLCHQHRWKPLLSFIALVGIISAFAGAFQDLISPVHDWLFPKADIGLEVISQYNTVPAYLESSHQKNMDWIVKWGTRINLTNTNDRNIRINDLKFSTNSGGNLIFSMPQPFYRVIDSKLFKNEYPIFLSKNSLLELDVVFHIKVIPKSIQPTESLDDKSIYNSIIAEEFGCPREKKECGEMVLNIDLNYTDDRAEFSKSFPLRVKIDFAGKISPTGGIISNYKVTPFTVLGHGMKEYVATVMYAGFSGGEKEIFQNMETKELHKHFLANNSDFDICSALFTRVVTDRDFVYASEVLSNCRPSSRFEESMLKNNYGVLAIEEKNYSKGLAYLLEAQKIERCSYLSDKNLFEYYMFKNEYHKATEVALKRLLDCKNLIDHWAYVLCSLFPKAGTSRS